MSSPEKQFTNPGQTPQQIKFLDQLSEEQKQAVRYIDGNSIISAGAGSGKTRVLTYKIAYLISKQVPPSSILALTFTNKAANEMKNRIIELLDNRSIYELWMGTFHSIFLRILRENFEYLNEKYKLNKNFTIYDQKCKMTVLDPIIEKNINAYKSAKNNNDKKLIQEILFEIADDISKIKNECKTIDECINNSNIAFSNYSQSKIKKIYNDYVNKCRISNAMDFDDILLYTYNMLSDNKAIAEKYKSLFNYILVDEYQDTNTIQFNIIDLIHGDNSKICVVGDDAQCIYSFRGSKIENIKKFRKTYSPVEYKLSVNYRSTKTIVDAANKLIQKNYDQSSKILITNAEKNSHIEESKIKIISSEDEKDEAKKVVDKIIELHNKDNEINNWNSFGILYRTHKQAEAFETQLQNSNIPYKIIGKIKFLEREIIVHIISYLRIIINENDNLSLQKILNLSFSEITLKLKKIFDDADKNQMSYWKVINNLNSYKKKLDNEEKIKNFIVFIDFLKQKAITEEPLYLIEQIVNYISASSNSNSLLFDDEDNKLIILLKQMANFLTQKYYNDCCDNKIDNNVIDEKNKLEQKKNHESDSDDSENDENDENNNNNENKINISENIILNNSENIHNIGKIVKYGIKEFIDDLILLNNNEDLTENIHYLDSTSDGENIKGKSDNVKLMTIHSSKGLEFNSVFVVGVEKGYYPIFHPNIKEKIKHEEEERRMFYVAITRAKRNCFISYAKKRLMGTGKVMNREKSQFINELENRCLDFSGDYNNQDDNNFSLNKSSFNRFLFNNYNNNNNDNSYNQPTYKKKNYYKYNKNYSYLNKKRNNNWK